MTGILRRAQTSCWAKQQRDADELRMLIIELETKLVDKLGNTSDEIVVRSWYPAKTVADINFENFNAQDAWEISKKTWTHPAIRKD